VVSRPDPESFPTAQYETLDDWVRAEEKIVEVRVTKGADAASMVMMLTDPIFATMVKEGPLGYPLLGMDGDDSQMQSVMGDWIVYVAGEKDFIAPHFEGVLRCAAEQDALLEGYSLPES